MAAGIARHTKRARQHSRPVAWLLTFPRLQTAPVIRRCNQLADAAQDVVRCALLRLDMGGEQGPHLQPGEVQTKAHVRSRASIRFKTGSAETPPVPFPFAVVLGDLS
jgi:hypothetical protein